MKKFILGFVTAAMFFGGIGTYAATSSKIDVLWNVKAIKFDGVTKTPSNKPFVYNGSTYVPLRFVGENLNKEVIWDKATQSVLINTKKSVQPKVTYLGDTVKYMNYQESHSYNSAILVYNNKIDLQNGYYDIATSKDNLGSVYKHFLVMDLYQTSGDQSNSLVEFPLNFKYNQFSTKLGLKDEYKNDRNTAIVDFLVDGEVIKSVELKAGDFPEDVTIGVKNGKKLGIRLTRSGSEWDYTGVILGNPVLK
ncbi:copper amine oxidase N-terminal domain-containing protein [Sporosarcina sp. D27]|uniref:copper amine oxidase N-terminal domain-containing protein n=1 Tax=Sporosarcina sp. D27 TaxID=1382305 RepID=UPI000470FB1C|nr:copper amine oxidase N-terminal domain-containing protein [Sporosarcina sp. D27]